MKYEKLSKKIIQGIGGKENVKSVVHCATRLRFQLNNKTLLDKEKLEHLEGILSVVESTGQIQIVIGSNVADVYNDLVQVGNFNSGSVQSNNQPKEKVKLTAMIFELISGTFTPLLAPLAGAGMLKAILAVLVMFGVLSEKSGTYGILAAAGNAILYFLPVMIGITLAIKLGANGYMGGIIGASLLEPNFTSLMSNGDTTSFLGIPVLLMDYSSSIVPSFIAVLIYAQLEKFLKKVIHKDLQLFLSPMISLIIIVPLTVLAFGPFGIYVGKMITSSINFLSEHSGLLTGAVIGGTMIILVVFGLHWALIPMSIENLTNGGDPIDPMWAASTFAQMGIALGIFLKTKDKKLKSLAGSTTITGLLSGVTEPIIYGLILTHKRTLAYVIIVGAIGGAFIGSFKAEAKAFMLHSIFTLGGSTTPWLPYFLMILLTVGGATLLTYFFGYEDKPSKQKGKMEGEPKQLSNPNNTKKVLNKQIINSPLSGQVIPLSQVNDQVFSSEAMGKGIAINPNKGEVISPVNGTVTTMFPTGHAVGITSDDGIEILIHVGIDTVQLDGEYYTKLVETGDSVSMGQSLIQFEIDKIKEAGYETTTPIIVTNSNQFLDIIQTTNQSVSTNANLLTIVK
ncbi:beta-glucoside-specific PTS transporter subunit IIABC [Bacillus mycoides]|uniref:beta-glucoside-specific PTS transporter subunit IIABC n=1 Tax=Bacillus mycoides TaxID=1405 RepID=UPI001C02C783|nr:beta-glucoside-specific PTS transporter subunit IIABC [Bacillus mycoides]